VQISVGRITELKIQVEVFRNVEVLPQHYTASQPRRHRLKSKALRYSYRDIPNNIWILGKYGGKVWTRFFWLKIGTSDGILRTR